MAKLLQTLLPLLPFFFFMLASSTPHRLQSSSFQFERFNESKPETLIYQGGTHVPPGSTSLRLTDTDSDGNPKKNSVGRVLYSRPVHMWDKSTGAVARFQTSIKFHITSSFFGEFSNDGLAFFIAPVNTGIPVDSSSGNLGIFSGSSGASSLFAVEFDAFPDPFFDPYYRHIGIDINCRESEVYSKFDSATGEEVTAVINYEPTTGLISVSASAGSQHATVTYKFDLSKILPEWVQVGISSSTGYFSACGTSNIHAWNFLSSIVHVDNDKDTYIRQHVDV